MGLADFGNLAADAGGDLDPARRRIGVIDLVELKRISHIKTCANERLARLQIVSQSVCASEFVDDDGSYGS